MADPREFRGITLYDTQNNSTVKEFSKTPWSTSQKYVLDSINALTEEAGKSYIQRFSKEQRLYLLNINTLEEVKLNLVPDQMSESYSSKVVSVSPFGTVTPINFYVGGNSKQLSFAFNMHEDLQSIGNSIYNVIEVLENMAKPVYRNGRLYDPIVYFQLGDQFVGKGHIQASFSYSKPFRNGRFTVVDVSMSFTFHEEFENDPISLNDTFSSEVSPFALQNNITEDFTFVDDFIKFQTDPDYFITQVFDNQKFRTYFNTVLTTIDQASQGYSGLDARASFRFRNENERTTFAENLQSSTINTLLKGQMIENTQQFSNPFALALIELFFNLRDVMFEARSENIGQFIEYYVNLNKALQDLRNQYITSYRPGTTNVNDGIGWYKQSSVRTFNLNPQFETGNTAVTVIRMSEAERDAFEELLVFLEKILTEQTRFYESLRGAGN